MNNLQTLLIVDDSQLNRELLMEILGTDYRYLQAEDGQQAIDILRGNPAVDLMLLDMVMPGLDGCGVLEIMQRYHWLDEIPVIVISADQSDAFMDRAYSLGATDYIHRPFHTLVVDPLPDAAPTATTRQSPSPSPGCLWRKPATHSAFASLNALAALPAESSMRTPRAAMARLTLFRSVAEPHDPVASSL